MKLSTAQHGAAVYRVSIPFTLSHPLHTAVETLATRINITPAQLFITSFIALLYTQSNQQPFNLYVQIPPTTDEVCVSIAIEPNTSFYSLANTVAHNLRGTLIYPVHIRFDHNEKYLELELQRFSGKLQPYVGYNPRQLKRQPMLELIDDYRSLLTCYTTRSDSDLDAPLKLMGRNFDSG